MVKINFGLIITGILVGAAAGTALHFLNPGNKLHLPSALAFHGGHHHGHGGGGGCGGGGHHHGMGDEDEEG